MEIIFLSLSLLATASTVDGQSRDHRVTAHAVASAQIVSGERVQMDGRMFQAGSERNRSDNRLPLARSINDQATVGGEPIIVTEFY